jgi:O-antigen/teichoic acid export membrane protein
VTLLLRVLRDRGLLPHPAWRRLDLPFREVFSFAFPLLSGEVVHLSMNSVSVVLLGYYATTSQVAVYRAVFPAARLNQLVLWTFAVLFMPLAARLYARNDRAGMGDAYWHSALWVAVATFPIFALTGPFAQSTAVTLFGEQYRESGQVLAILAIGYYVNAALGFNALTLQTVGRLRWLVKVNIAVALLNIAFAFALVPRWGAVGVATANAVTLIAQNGMNQLALQRSIGVGVFDRRGVPVFAMIIAAALGLAVFQRTVAPHFAVAVVVAGVTSLLLLVVNRRRLHLAETFPEVARVPVIGRLLTG